MPRYFVMNSAVLTTYGEFVHERIDEHEAIDWLKQRDWVSAVGHEVTALMMSHRLGIHIPYHRMMVQMRPGDEVLVLKVLRRLPDAYTLTPYDIQHTACGFSVIRMR